MTALGTIIIAGLWSAAVGCMWLAGLSLATGCGDNEAAPGPELVQCEELGADLRYPPLCLAEGCSYEGMACEVPSCGIGEGLLHGPDGRVGCNQSLCTINYGQRQTLCDQSR